MAIAHHIMLRLVDSRVIAPTEPARCVLARSILGVGRDLGLLAFRGSDIHVHVEAVCSRRAAGELARRAELSLGRRLALPVSFERARIKAVGDQRHLANLFDYLMRQEDRHGTALDPDFTASSLPDLLGMRVLGGYTMDRVCQHLPRVRRPQLLSYLGVCDLDAAPLSLDHLADAAAAAFGLLDLGSNRREAVRARRAAAQAALSLGTAEAVAAKLGVKVRAIHRLRTQPVAPAAVAAVKLQLRRRSARAGLVDTAPAAAAEGCPPTLPSPCHVAL